MFLKHFQTSPNKYLKFKCLLDCTCFEKLFLQRRYSFILIVGISIFILRAVNAYFILTLKILNIILSTSISTTLGRSIVSSIIIFFRSFIKFAKVNLSLFNFRKVVFVLSICSYIFNSIICFVNFFNFFVKLIFLLINIIDYIFYAKKLLCWVLTL